MATIRGETRRDPLQDKIDKLKDPNRYREFGTEEMASLTQAIDILNEIRSEVSGNNMVAWDKLYKATKYLEGLQKAHLEQD
jgi:hypothetical protein